MAVLIGKNTKMICQGFVGPVFWCPDDQEGGRRMMPGLVDTRFGNRLASGRTVPCRRFDPVVLQAWGPHA